MDATTDTPTRPGTLPEKIDPETERIILDRLATFDSDAKSSVDAREALDRIRRSLKTPAVR